jgi:hypothetical protein
MLFIGSCFSENIFKELNGLKFYVSANPQGIIFNPISLSKCLTNIISNKKFNDFNVFNDCINSDIIHSWDHHSSYSRVPTMREKMLNKMNEELYSAHKVIVQGDALFITLGTAFVHELVKTGEVVSNCHKR